MRGYALIAQGVVYPAPWLQFGEPAGATAGELLQIPVDVRHGTVVAATIELADGRVLDLDVYGDRFELLLPPDAADGPAIVRVRLVDLTGNTSSAQTVVLRRPSQPRAACRARCRIAWSAARPWSCASPRRRARCGAAGLRERSLCSACRARAGSAARRRCAGAAPPRACASPRAARVCSPAATTPWRASR
jgi:hypothetical protein